MREATERLHRREVDRVLFSPVTRFVSGTRRGRGVRLRARRWIAQQRGCRTDASTQPETRDARRMVTTPKPQAVYPQPALHTVANRR